MFSTIQKYFQILKINNRDGCIYINPEKNMKIVRVGFWWKNTSIVKKQNKNKQTNKQAYLTEIHVVLVTNWEIGQ